MPINPNIETNSRITYLRSLKSAVELHDFIKELDAKYGIDSSDPDNSFGRVNLDNPIIKYGAANTLYFANISRFDPEDMRLPRFKNAVKKQMAILLTNTGEATLRDLNPPQVEPLEPLLIDEEDVLKLKELRKAFEEEINQHQPPYPNRVKALDYLDKKYSTNEKPFEFDKYSPFKRDQFMDEAMRHQGFASGKYSTFKDQITINNGDKEGIFEVRYGRIGGNTCCDYATTYNGWQNQEEMPKDHPAYAFYQKWDIFQTSPMTIEEWVEMKADWEMTKKESEGL